jgi:iron complex outermembrane receptor protein
MMVQDSIINAKRLFKRFLCCWGLVCLLFSCSAYAQEGGLGDLTLQDLMNIEMVSGSKFKQDLSEVTASAYVITEEDIKHAGVTDLPQLFKMVPGLFVAEASANSWAMGMRGFNGVFSNKMLVMIDGRSLFSPLFSGVFWEQLDLFIPDIARIEVIRGVGSTVWGANAVNGIINIITKSTLDNENTRFYVNSGSSVNYDAGIRLGGQVSDNSYARVYVKSKDIKGFDYKVPDGDIDDSWSSDAIGVKWELFAGRDSLVVSSDFIDQSVNDTGLVTSRANVRQVALTNRNVNASFQWQRQMSTDKAFTLSSQVQQNRRYGESYRIDDHVFNVDFDINYQWQDHQLLMGVGARQHDIDFEPGLSFAIASNETSISTTAKILSGYIQDEWRFGEFHSLIFGTKFESHVHDDDQSGFAYEADLWLPTLRYRYDMSDNAKIWAGVSKSARIPSVSEHLVQMPLFTLSVGSPLNPFPWPFEVATSGDIGFKKENVMAYELGFRANLNTANSIDLVVYHNQFDDVRTINFTQPICVITQLPAPMCAPNDQVTEYDIFGNGGRLSTSGLEVSWLSRVTKDVNLSVSYSYLNQATDALAPNQSYLDTTRLVAKHQLGVKLDWHTSEKSNIRLMHKYLSGIDDSPLVRVQNISGFMDHYQMFDIIGSYELTASKKLTLTVTNLLQQRGTQWIPEFPDGHVSESERRFSLGIDVTF